MVTVLGLVGGAHAHGWGGDTARQRLSNEVDVTVLGLVGGAPGGQTPRVADSSAAGAGRCRTGLRTGLVCLHARLGLKINFA